MTAHRRQPFYTSNEIRLSLLVKRNQPGHKSTLMYHAAACVELVACSCINAIDTTPHVLTKEELTDHAAVYTPNL